MNYVREVQAAIAAHPVVVAGMRQNPMPYEAAQKMEQDLADALQEKGWAVWQA